MTPPTHIQTISPFGVIAAVLITLAVLGCGGESAGPSNDSADVSAEPAAALDEGSASESSDSAPPSVARVDADGRKWLGEIPYDVWFDNPLAVAADTQQVATASQAPEPTNGTAEMTTAAPPTPKQSAGGAAADWQSLIPAQIVEAEAKKIRTRLATRLKSLGEYNRTYLEVQWEGATMAGLGVIADQHTEPVSWKDQAKVVRELGLQIQTAAESTGKKSYDPAQLAYEKYVAILDGNVPAELPEASADVPFSDETVSRAGLMRRMEAASEYLKKNIITEEKLSSAADDAAHEAAVLAALTKAIASPGYVYADEEEFQKYAREMLDATVKMQQAIPAKDFAAFTEGVNVVQNKCNECHVNGGYRTGG